VRARDSEEVSKRKSEGGRGKGRQQKGRESQRERNGREMTGSLALALLFPTNTCTSKRTLVVQQSTA